MFGKPQTRDILPAVKLTTFLFIFSWVALYLVFYPLSFILPNFVDYWLFYDPAIIYDYGGDYALLPNLLGFISLAVLPAICEELVFRGVLLHRWSEKWGMTPAILLSSFVFGLAHDDPVGATAFGIGMCFLYLKTQTLWVPILCHALNNAVVWFWLLFESVYYGEDYFYSLENFQSGWYYAVGLALVMLAWVVFYARSPQEPAGSLSLPGIER